MRASARTASEVVIRSMIAPPNSQKATPSATAPPTPHCELRIPARRSAPRSRAPTAAPTSASAAKAKPSSAKAVISRNCSSTWFAASVTSPRSEARNRKVVKDAVNSTERIMMSAFTASIRFRRAGSNTRAQSRHWSPKNAARHSHKPIASPDHSATSVATATPCTPQPSPRTNHTSSTTLMPFIQSCSTSTPRVRSIPISQPVTA